ncbi:MAG: hypothetical protein U0T36_11250 [Saprospiraceae bacterium]
MKTRFLNFPWMMIFVIGLFITSCTDSTDVNGVATDTTDTESYAEEVVTRTVEGGALGKNGCYELVFPVTLVFADSTTVSVDSYEALKTAVKEWRTNNPDVKGKPSLAFPYDVINEAGEVITVTDATVQKELRALCGKNPNGGHGNGGNGGNDGNGGHGHGPSCFTINYPFSVSLPDSTIITLNSKDDQSTLRDAIKEYKKNNPGVKVHPELVFPITVTMSDGTVVTVNTKEELKALKDSCD